MTTYGNAPYRPASDKYWQTVYVRFSYAAVQRHRTQLMRGLVNRDLRDSGAGVQLNRYHVAVPA